LQDETHVNSEPQPIRNLASGWPRGIKDARDSNGVLRGD
jgi:hypothetical protein